MSVFQAAYSVAMQIDSRLTNVSDIISYFLLIFNICIRITARIGI